LKERKCGEKFEILITESAQELCEQLRLILEPTLTTKLKGDYRTGKRINMKKVIPYIASQFKKDKIWLRRTKPNKRNYQIIIAIDDSKSMANNQSGLMACEALTMIAKAMTQLEIGEIGIVKFGEEVQLLHSLQTPFTDKAGTEVITQFTFQQTKEDFANLLNKLVHILQLSKSPSQGDHMQLVFIISDGWLVMQEYTELNKWIREASEKNILIVFIIIDNPTNKNSILNAKSITIENKKSTRSCLLRLISISILCYIKRNS